MQGDWLRARARASRARHKPVKFESAAACSFSIAAHTPGMFPCRCRWRVAASPGGNSQASVVSHLSAGVCKLQHATMAEVCHCASNATVVNIANGSPEGTLQIVWSCAHETWNGVLHRIRFPDHSASKVWKVNIVAWENAFIGMQFLHMSTLTFRGARLDISQRMMHSANTTWKIKKTHQNKVEVCGSTKRPSPSISSASAVT